MSRLRTRSRWVRGLLAIGLGSGLGAPPVGAESSAGALPLVAGLGFVVPGLAWF